MDGLAATPNQLLDTARAMGASSWQTTVKVRLPAALPQIFTGLKLAVSLAMLGAIVANITNPGRGLGSVIVLSGVAADTTVAFAAIVVLTVVSVLLYFAVVTLERLLLPWTRLAGRR
jgi:NitT/TauT family transport system permease protein